MTEEPVIPARAKRVLETSRKMGAVAKAEIATAIEAKQIGKPVAWAGVGSLGELLRCFDIAVTFPENYGTATAAAGVAPPCIETTLQWGFPRSQCSYFTINFGFAAGVKDRSDIQFPGGGMPVPDFLLMDDTYCVHRVGWFRTVSELLKIPLFVVDGPFLSKRQSFDRIDDYAVEYLASQLKEAVLFLEEQTGQRFDEDKLKEIMRLSNQTTQLFGELVELSGKTVPCPVATEDFAYLLYALNCLIGTQVSVDLLREARDEVKARIERGEGVVPEEKHRLLFWGNPPYYALGVLSYPHRYGAVFVSAPMLFITFTNPWLPLDPEKPFESLARRYLCQYLNFSFDKCAELQDCVIREYRIDGIFYLVNIGCKPATAPQYYLKSLAEERHGLPTVLLELEQADPEGYDPVRVASALDVFMEMVEGKKSHA